MGTWPNGRMKNSPSAVGVLRMTGAEWGTFRNAECGWRKRIGVQISHCEKFEKPASVAGDSQKSESCKMHEKRKGQSPAKMTQNQGHSRLIKVNQGKRNLGKLLPNVGSPSSRRCPSSAVLRRVGALPRSPHGNGVDRELGGMCGR